MFCARFHRSMSRPFFTREKISHFDTFDRHAEDIIDQIRERLREGIAVDVQVRFSLVRLSISHFIDCTIPRTHFVDLRLTVPANSYLVLMSILHLQVYHTPRPSVPRTKQTFTLQTHILMRSWPLKYYQRPDLF
jgi:hypothetical protein